MVCREKILQSKCAVAQKKFENLTKFESSSYIFEDPENAHY